MAEDVASGRIGGNEGSPPAANRLAQLLRGRGVQVNPQFLLKMVEHAIVKHGIACWVHSAVQRAQIMHADLHESEVDIT